MDKPTRQKVWGGAYALSFFALMLGHASNGSLNRRSDSVTSNDIDSLARSMADRMTKTLDEKTGDVL